MNEDWLLVPLQHDLLQVVTRDHERHIGLQLLPSASQPQSSSVLSLTVYTDIQSYVHVHMDLIHHIASGTLQQVEFGKGHLAYSP